jgi:hypothetical protein
MKNLEMLPRKQNATATEGANAERQSNRNTYTDDTSGIVIHLSGPVFSLNFDTFSSAVEADTRPQRRSFCRYSTTLHLYTAFPLTARPTGNT